MHVKIYCILALFAISSGFSQENWTKFGTSPVLQRDTVIANLSNDFYAISDNWVIRDGDSYKMWYTCGGFNYPTDEFNLNARICYCESENGIDWIKHESNPVLDLDYGDGWDSLGVETVTVIKDIDAPIEARYKMWYAGVTESGGKYNLGYAYSTDGIIWVKHPDPILVVGDDTDWDNGFLEGPSVIKDGSLYKMWYAGFDATFEGAETDGLVNIGYATSADGITWEKYAGNPVLKVSESGWDSIYVQDPHVIKNDGIYHMWYGGANQYDLFRQETGYASSTDGINWVKSPLNPVLKRGDLGSWDANTASYPTVLLDDGIFKMWYTGKDVEPLPEESTAYFWEIGYAVGDTMNLSLPEINAETSIYPNPFQDQLRVESTESIRQIEIYDFLGKQVLNYRGLSNSVVIDVSDLQKGIYLIVVDGIAGQKMIKD